MKKYSVYFWSMLVILLGSTVGIGLCYMDNNPDVGAILSMIWIIVFVSIGLMPDSDRYKKEYQE